MKRISGRLMKSVSASIYFLSQRFAHVALEKVIDDQHQEYNNSDDEAPHPPATKRIGSGTLLRNFLSRSQSLNSRGHKPRRQEPSDLHRLWSKSEMAFEHRSKISLGLFLLMCSSLFQTGLTIITFLQNIVQQQCHRWFRMLTPGRILCSRTHLTDHL